QQLQAIEAGAAFRLLAERHGAAEIGEVRRQTEQWMRDATRMFATSRTGEAIAAYGQTGMVHAADTRDAARAALIDRWDIDRRAAPTESRIILTHMN
ncbi:Ti-type conjugative transfer relaxase TraA, partial [Pseudomonas sp. MPR-R1B]|uniref:AAA family ATPase n=1 Tax=Pseudomonas sp. MPR-R1B TaxID=2070678 RepID=UPI000CA9715C